MNWLDLTRELDRWHESARTATFWWRDDDAMRRSGELARLVEVSRRRRVPVALAVVPGRATEDVAWDVSDASAFILQHGCRHVNRAPANAKKCEMVAGVERELAEGLAKLKTLFGDVSLPILVPPWNRIDPALLPRLADLGYRGLSTFKPRDARTVAGLRQVNTHIDVVDWRLGRGFRSEDEVLAVTVEHLRARRMSAVDPDEPTGLLTHHLDHDEACWAFVDRLLAETRDHPAVRWLGAEEVFVA